MKKRLLAILLIIPVLLAAAACGSSGPEGVLTVGTGAMNGDFIYGFGSNAYDKFVKELTSGYNYCSTYAVTPDGAFALNEVIVESLETSLDDTGNKTYTFTIHQNLKWNDGTGITGRDFVFNMLMSASDEWAAAGSTAADGNALVGYRAFHTGETDIFEGVRLLGDYQFSFTVAAENLPYFYEPAFVTIYPTCMASWAPGASIESTDAGAKISGADMAEVAARTASGERYAPTVTCGPYKFVSFSDQVVTLEVNGYFGGDLNGKKPRFKSIIIKEVTQGANVEQVISGDVDLVTGVTESEKIEAAKAADTANLHSCKRNGYSLLAFHCDWGVTADPNVRWAVASLIDRDQVLSYVLDGYGVTADGMYGYAQWMYRTSQTELAEKLTPIAFSIQKANEYLDLTEWRYEKDGKTPFDASKANSGGAYMRYNSAGEKLRIEHQGAQENKVTESIEIQMGTNAPLAGLEFNVTTSDFRTMIDNYYYGYELGDERFFNTFNLVTGFDTVFDPYYASVHSDFAGTRANPGQISDPELDRLITEMRSLEPSQTEEYRQKWVDFQVRYNQLLPSIPLCSDEYFDISGTRITEPSSTPFLSWALTVCDLSFAK